MDRAVCIRSVGDNRWPALAPAGVVWLSGFVQPAGCAPMPDLAQSGATDGLPARPLAYLAITDAKVFPKPPLLALLQSSLLKAKKIYWTTLDSAGIIK
jgi:hypothetical protein